MRHASPPGARINCIARSLVALRDFGGGRHPRDAQVAAVPLGKEMVQFGTIALLLVSGIQTS